MPRIRECPRCHEHTLIVRKTSKSVQHDIGVCRECGHVSVQVFSNHACQQRKSSNPCVIADRIDGGR